MSDTQVYVGTYAKYNSGSIAGKWLTLSDYAGKDDFIEACNKLHSDEADPELMFQDWQGAAAAAISEGDVPEEVWDFEALDDSDKETVTAWMETQHGSLADALDYAVTDFVGVYDSEQDFAAQQLEGSEEIPSWLEPYIDYESYGRDLLTGFSYGELHGRLWVWQ